MKDKKYCPYNIHIEQVNQNRYEYDESGHNTFHEHKLLEMQAPSPCKGSECAAWHRGRCRRTS
ncbi:MAG: hypothetical protein BWY15_00333 [Firmicutes bacterium ADurb.Bin193]|nr:MAG: hypothetical protein BWY15_00333 [Firmicutes bacterium ADurb.Bin193]